MAGCARDVAAARLPVRPSARHSLAYRAMQRLCHDQGDVYRDQRKILSRSRAQIRPCGSLRRWIIAISDTRHRTRDTATKTTFTAHPRAISPVIARGGIRRGVLCGSGSPMLRQTTHPTSRIRAFLPRGDLVSMMVGTPTDLGHPPLSAAAQAPGRRAAAPASFQCCRPGSRPRSHRKGHFARLPLKHRGEGNRLHDAKAGKSRVATRTPACPWTRVP